jgi:ribonuclease HII
LGAIFGDLVACAVMMPTKFLMPVVDDSKKLSHETIYKIAPKLRKMVQFSLGVVSSSELLSLSNMGHGNQIALKRAIEGLPEPPDAVFVDGCHPIHGLKIDNFPVIKGDSKVFGIAVASIIGKDYRDHLVMDLYGQKYARYHINSNKGYRSPDHLIGIRFNQLKEGGPGISKHHHAWMPQIKKVLNGEYDEVIHGKYQDRWEALK